MDAVRWNRLRQILDEVGDLSSTPNREAALVAACAGDATLYEDLLALLAPDRIDDSLVRGIVTGVVSDLLAEDPAGQRVGRAPFIREIGHGGMGAVYLADRVDGEFEQRVALKLVKPGLETGQFLRRFREDGRSSPACSIRTSLACSMAASTTEDGPSSRWSRSTASRSIRYCDDAPLDDATTALAALPECAAR